MTLPANSTFLPVLDDLLSPDFRPVLLPAQTPQTPNDVITFGGGKLITNAYGNIAFNQVSARSHVVGDRSLVVDNIGGAASSAEQRKNPTTISLLHRNSSADSEAAAKIQSWWKSKRSQSIDLNAERAKHAIRHSRTEDHVRYLESEVNRLKSALSSERKIRSLQLEAIRSLWNQMQRISTSATSLSQDNPMTRSVPNGLAKDPCSTTDNVMSMSLNTALSSVVLPDSKLQNNTNDNNSTSTHSSSCACSKEVQHLQEVFTQEISQLRTLIHQLTNKDTTASTATVDDGSTAVAKEDEGASNGKQKRPLSLNILGIASNGTGGSDSNHQQYPASSPEVLKNLPEATVESTEQITQYANQMASKLVDDAVEDKNTE